MAAARACRFGRFAGVRLAGLAFLDEFGAATNMTRARARGPRGERVVCNAPRGHWKVTSTTAAMSVRGLFARGSFGGATDADAFVAFAEDGLVPRLRPGRVVVFDDLPAHRSPRVDALIESAGARVLRRPPYSPDFNPIEMAISTVKSALRKLGRRTVPALTEAIGEATAAVTAADALGFIRHCGYSATAV